MSAQEIEAWLDEHAEARLKVRQRSRGPRTHRRQPSGDIETLRPATRRASLTNSPVGKRADGQATETGRRIEESVTRHSGAVARHRR